MNADTSFLKRETLAYVTLVVLFSGCSDTRGSRRKTRKRFDPIREMSPSADWPRHTGRVAAYARVTEPSLDP